MLSEVKIFEIAKLLYFDLEKGEPGGWDKLSSDAQENRVKDVKAIMESLGKLGFDILPNYYTKPDKRKKFDKVQLEYLIKDFIVKNIKRPPGIVNIFPYQALADEIAKTYAAE